MVCFTRAVGNDTGIFSHLARQASLHNILPHRQILNVNGSGILSHSAGPGANDHSPKTQN